MLCDFLLFVTIFYSLHRLSRLNFSTSRVEWAGSQRTARRRIWSSSWSVKSTAQTWTCSSTHWRESPTTFAPYRRRKVSTWFLSSHLKLFQWDQFTCFVTYFHMRASHAMLKGFLNQLMDATNYKTTHFLCLPSTSQFPGFPGRWKTSTDATC